MHEMSLAEGIRSIVDEAVSAQRLGRVRAVVLEIGELAAVEVEALAFCFDEVMRGSAAEGARMEVFSVAGSGWCPECACSVALHRLVFYVMPASLLAFICFARALRNSRNGVLYLLLPFVVYGAYFAVWAFYSGHARSCYDPYESWLLMQPWQVH